MPTRSRLLAIASAVLCLGVAACGDTSVVPGTSSASPTNATAASPTEASTGKAVLGGPGSAFIATYGPLTNQSNPATGDLHFREYPGVAQDFLIVDLASYYGYTPANDAFSILAAPPPGQPWSPSAAHAMCAAFFPSDAHEVNQVQVSQGGAVVGQDVIYQSVTLAALFPASNFMDAHQNPAQPGSFDVNYLYTPNSTGSEIDSCELLLGTQQTT